MSPSSPPRVRHAARPGRGAACAVGSALAFAAMGLLVHRSAGESSPAALALSRGLFGALALLPFVWRDVPSLLRPDAFWLWARSAAGALSVLCFFHTLQRTGVATARALTDVAPAFVVAIAWTTRAERPSLPRGTIVLAMVGAAVLLESDAVAGAPADVLAIGLCGAFFASLAYLALRRAALQFRNPLVVFGLACGMAMGAAASPGGLAFGVESAPLLVGVGVLGLVGQLLMTHAYVHLEASVASALGVTALTWSLLLDVLVQGARPGPAALACYGAILAGAVLLHVLERRRKQGGAPAGALPAVAAEPTA